MSKNNTGQPLQYCSLSECLSLYKVSKTFICNSFRSYLIPKMVYLSMTEKWKNWSRIQIWIRDQNLTNWSLAPQNLIQIQIWSGIASTSHHMLFACKVWNSGLFRPSEIALIKKVTHLCTQSPPTGPMWCVKSQNLSWAEELYPVCPSVWIILYLLTS